MGEKVDKQGVKHWNVKNYKYNYDLKGKADVQLSNLFDGNEVLSKYCMMCPYKIVNYCINAFNSHPQKIARVAEAKLANNNVKI